MESHPDSSAAPGQGVKMFSWVIRGVLVSSVCFVAGVFAWMVSQRLAYPFELEWMEGAMADHVARVLDGRQLYTAPSYDHVANLYPPGFFYVTAAFGKLSGLGDALVSLRVVSVAATLLTCLFLYRLVQRDGTRIGGLAAAGVYVAAYFLAGCYYDTGRIDPLFSCLLLDHYLAVAGVL